MGLSCRCPLDREDGLASRRRQQLEVEPPRPRSLWGRGRGLAPFRRSPVLRNAGVLLSILALAIQASLPSGHRAAMALAGKTASYTQSVAFLGDGLALCSTQSRDHRGRSDSSDKAPPPNPSPCPICQATQSLANLVLPATTLSLEGARLVIPHRAPSRKLAVARPIHEIPQPRAPPVTV